MIPFFHSPERQKLLQRVADSWIGTPFHPNAEVKGAGVSCQTLAAGILRECGVFPESFEIPRGSMRWSQSHTRSLIAQHMDALPQFVRVFSAGSDKGPTPTATLGQSGSAEMFSFMPGDMIGYRIGSCIHHVGLALNAAIGIHVMKDSCVCYYPLSDAAFADRVEAVWRPIC